MQVPDHGLSFSNMCSLFLCGFRSVSNLITTSTKEVFGSQSWPMDCCLGDTRSFAPTTKILEISSFPTYEGRR